MSVLYLLLSARCWIRPKLLASGEGTSFLFIKTPRNHRVHDYPAFVFAPLSPTVINILREEPKLKS